MRYRAGHGRPATAVERIGLAPDRASDGGIAGSLRPYSAEPSDGLPRALWKNVAANSLVWRAGARKALVSRTRPRHSSLSTGSSGTASGGNLRSLATKEMVGME